MSATNTLTALEELLSRAGASDKDRPAWLAERACGVTATEVKDLYMKGAGYRADLIALKLGIRTDSFSGNQYTAWGKKREPIIAEWVRSRWAIEDESRVFHAADNPRFLASPDGIGVNYDGELQISEIKTSGHNIAPTTVKYRETGYRIQKTWGMRVTGARRCLYAWEQHNGDWQDRGGEYPEPVPLNPEPSFAWFEYDEALAAELEVVAVEFLVELDAARAALEAGEEPEYDDALDTMAVNYLRFIDLEKEATAAKQAEWAAMLERLEGCDALSQQSSIARVTFSPPVTEDVEEADVEAAKQADPQLFAEVQALSKRWNEHAAQFKKVVPKTKRANLRVTAVKAEKEKKA